MIVFILYEMIVTAVFGFSTESLTYIMGPGYFDAVGLFYVFIFFLC